MKIILNIGHGGSDPGATGADGTDEHVFNRDELAPRLIRELEAAGHTVKTIIQKNSFGELPARINAEKPDIILSLHFNCHNGLATGTETLFWLTSKRSRRLAECIQKRIVAALALPDRGIKGLLIGRGSALLRRTNAPCVILEPFFGDNPHNLTRARARIRELAMGIAAGVADFAAK